MDYDDCTDDELEGLGRTGWRDSAWDDPDKLDEWDW